MNPDDIEYGDNPVYGVPPIGERVIYFAYGTPGGEFTPGEPRAAIVTAVAGMDDVSLCVLNPSGLFFNQHVRYAPGKGGCWGWEEDGNG